MLLLVTPPLTQLNTPYPATTQLKAFLDDNGVATSQLDLGIELVDEILSPQFLRTVYPDGHPMKERVLTTISSVKRFLRGGDDSLAMRIASRTFLPEGPRFQSLGDLEWSFGVAGTLDLARHLATLYIEDIADFIRDNVDQHFDLVRYAEQICTYAETFDEIENQLQKPPTSVERLMLSLFERHLSATSPSIVGFSVPFPGCLLAALRCAQHIKRHHPQITVEMGGGFVNTELRQLSDPRLFDYVDYVTLDDGELPLLRLARFLEGRLQRSQLLRTFCRVDGRVVYIDDLSSSMPTQVRNADLPTPSFDGLPMHLYLSMSEMANPMHSLWSSGRWNKLMMAHGCYWAKCAFCDTSLDYIGRYDAPDAVTVVDRMQRIAEQTGSSGFHFVDEALPPKLLWQVCEEIVRRSLVFSFWGNIRFEKAFTADFCQLLAEAGCIAVSGGLEVASDRLLQLIGKGVSVSQTMQVARHFSDAGIMVHTYLMYGFPTETLQETIMSLDNVRSMFSEGIVQSAFWHRYAMTVHSPSGRAPRQYGARHCDGLRVNPFCNNEIPFDAHFDYDLDAVGTALRLATYNFMNGIGLEKPAAKWFKGIRQNK